MKIRFLFIVITSVLIIGVACENDNDSVINKKDFSGDWQRTGYLFNGNIGIDTISIQQIGDSIFITDNEFIDETGCIGLDTIDIIESNTIGFSFLEIITERKLNSNTPVNRTIDSIIFKKIN